MEDKSKKILIGIIIIVVIAVFAIIHIMIESINKMKTLDYYKIDNEKVTAITNVVGKREVNGFSSSIKNGITSKEYRYKNVQNTRSDINLYIKELVKNEFINTTNIDLSDTSDKIKLAKKSIENNKIILVTISYNEHNYTIKIEKGKGSIQPYN